MVKTVGCRPMLAFVVCAAIVVGLASSQVAQARSSVAGSSPFLITRNGNTYQAQSQTTGTTYTGTLKFVMESAAVLLNGGGGGTVTFAAGTFDFGSQFFKVHDLHNITFEGQGIDVTVLRNSSSAAADTEPFNFSGTFGVVVRDMTVSAGGPLRTTSDALDFDFGNDSTVERVKVIASRGRAIVFDGKDAGWHSANNVVRDCVITGVQSDGIEFLASTNNLVEGCTISNTGGHGIQAAKSSTGAPQPNKKASDNIIRNNVIDNAGQDGINVNGGDRNRIEGNQITNSANISANKDGIRVGTSDNVSCDDTIVENNTATDNQPTKTQRYGLFIASPLCNRTVVGTNDFAGNKTGPFLDRGTNTQSSLSDTSPPTSPTGVTAAALSHALVRITWTASTDNVGVTGYRIYRNGAGTPMATVGGGTLTFDDTTVAASTTYTYRVAAIDAVPNVSQQSSPPASATTPAPPPDTQPPTTPTGVTASAISHALVRVTWNASTDNVGVAGYRIYRNGGAPMATVSGSALSFDDTTVAPGTTYTYTVDAVDAVPNPSPQSSPPASATTPAAPSAFTFTPVADSYVNETAATTNYGTSTQVRVDGSPVVRAYLRFEVKGVVGTVTSARLRIYANSASSTGHEVHAVADNTWGETTITFANAPAVESSVVATSGSFAGGGYVEVDVTSLITGNGTYSIALIGPGSTAISYASRESTNTPEVVINVT